MTVKNTIKYNIDLIIPVFLIILAELLIFSGNTSAAMPVHALNLVFLSLSSIYMDNRIYHALMLMPLFRLLNVAMPVFFNLTLYSYSIVYAPMFIPIYFILKGNFVSSSEAGLTFKGFWFYLPLALSMGLALGWGEHLVLRPQMLTVGLEIKDIFILIVTMIFFVGIVEEFIFRSSLQTVLQGRLGPKTGLALTSIIFGFMHSGYHIPLELFYVTMAGVAFGLLFWFSKSLPVIALAHGVTNISLFLISPLDPGVLFYLVVALALFFIINSYILKRIFAKFEAVNR